MLGRSLPLTLRYGTSKANHVRPPIYKLLGGAWRTELRFMPRLAIGHTLRGRGLPCDRSLAASGTGAGERSVRCR